MIAAVNIFDEVEADVTALNGEIVRRALLGHCCHFVDNQAIFADWDEKVAEAEAAGETTCKKCGFVYYLTIYFCPLCGHEHVEEHEND